MILFYLWPQIVYNKREMISIYLIDNSAVFSDMLQQLLEFLQLLEVLDFLHKNVFIYVREVDTNE